MIANGSFIDSHIWQLQSNIILSFVWGHVSGCTGNVRPIVTLIQFFLCFCQILREIAGSLLPKCSIMFKIQSLAESVCCLVLNRFFAKNCCILWRESDIRKPVGANRQQLILKNNIKKTLRDPSHTVSLFRYFKYLYYKREDLSMILYTSWN